MTAIPDVFRQHGLRRTRQRERVLETLLVTKTHPTADELLSLVRRDSPEGELSLATVYNTLEAFTRVGLCRRLPSPMGGGACRYDATLNNHVHVSLPDGAVLDVPEDLSERLLGAVPPEALAEIESRLGVKVGRLDLRVVAREHPAQPADG